ncbi:7tm Odorant receptor [Popillia japonica]|uniref:Odorant receptor n=1 Tax=Popillia japonica TaxID=7064 RepID=A0AAW1K066_POPJA
MIFRKKIRRFCQHIETHPFIPDRNRGGDIEFVYVGKAIRSCNIQGFVFYGLAVGTVVQLLCYAFTSPVRIKTIFDPITNMTTIKQTRALPFNCKLPFDTAQSPYFEIVSVTGTILGGSYGFSIGSMDAIICGIMCHIRAQLLILKECLRTFVERAVYLMKEDTKLSEFDSKMLETISKNVDDIVEIPSILQKYVRIAICQIIEHHQKVINLAKDTDDVFSLLMLTQFLFSLGILCFMLFQLSLTPVRSFHFFGMTCYLFLMLFQLYLYCYRGNEIIIHSHNITDEIFGSSWFLADVSTQKLLLTMMTRACRPIRMTAGKFVYLSLEAFMSIVRGSGSYFMVLKNTNAPRTD